MGNLQIISNYHWRLFDDMEAPEWSNEPEDTFTHRGHRYFISEFMAISDDLPKELQEWDGYLSDSYFSGILIRYNPENHDEYQIALYLS